MKDGNKFQEIRRGNGKDFLMGGKGNDTPIGGSGADFFKASKSENEVKECNWQEGDMIAITARSDYSLVSHYYASIYCRTLEGTVLTTTAGSVLKIEGITIDELQAIADDLVTKVV